VDAISLAQAVRLTEMPEIYGRSCVIAETARIGEQTRVGNFVFIRDNTIIGRNCVIGSYVDIEGDVHIGDFVSLQSGCYLTRGVIVEDNVFCGPRVSAAAACYAPALPSARTRWSVRARWSRGTCRIARSWRVIPRRSSVRCRRTR
jgi:NDP-sugar pyrophosphorylase family protein